MTTAKKDEFGHHFLVHLGKSRLRPGGKAASDWLLANGDFRQDKRILDVSFNFGATAIDVAKQFGCNVVCLVPAETLEKTQQNLQEQKVAELVQVQPLESLSLPFENNQFDIVINEAGLTMLSAENKAQAVQEYLRVLKPNGFLLCHDVMLNSDEAETSLAELREASHISLTPLTKDAWKQTFVQAGFRNVETFSGELALLSPKGLIYDEGVLGAIKVISNSLKAQNRDAFKKLFRAFNHPEKQLGFIAVCSQK